MVLNQSLPPQARYFPVQPGHYVMKAGLARLGTSFGNGRADRCVLQIDRQWPDYRRNKLRARAESLAKYYCCAEPIDAGVRRAVTDLLLHTMVCEYPAWFRRDGEQSLHCALSGEILHFDAQSQLWQTDAAQPKHPPYRDSLDALACQLQEDLAFVSAAPEGNGRVLMLHLCAPNHWAAADRIGRSFQAAHAPVPQFGRIARHTPALLANLRDSGPYVRFAWGLATDDRLNHHPESAADQPDPGKWQGRRFDPREPKLFLRVERQVLTGIPAANGFLFGIRTYFTDVTDLTSQQRRTLAAAVRAMSADIARYKGLDGQQAAIAQWLESVSPDAGAISDT